MRLDEYYALLQKALASPFGVVVDASEPYAARCIRRRFYYIRESARQQGDTSFDKLSFFVMGNGEVWIVKRDILAPRSTEDGYPVVGTREVQPGEIPERFTPRGKGKPRPRRYIPFGFF